MLYCGFSDKMLLALVIHWYKVHPVAFHAGGTVWIPSQCLLRKCGVKKKKKKSRGHPAKDIVHKKKNLSHSCTGVNGPESFRKPLQIKIGLSYTKVNIQ